MKYETFERRVRESGLTPRDCGKGHYRIEGGEFEVNWYPLSKKKTIYVNGLSRQCSTKYGDLKTAIRLANDEPVIKGRRRKGTRKKSYHGIKLRLLKKDPLCYWCKCDLNEKTMTADHKIPLARGGSNATDNIVLACEDCNKEKDNKIWKKKSSKKQKENSTS